MAARRACKAGQLVRVLGWTLLAALTAALATASAEQWSRFRGPNGSGISQHRGYPIELDPDSNLLWKTPVRRGKSSPVLTNEHLFLTAFEDDQLYTQCFDRVSGELLWEGSLTRPRQDPLRETNSPAAPSPVTDGENVYSFFQDFGLVSYDATGRLRWTAELGPFANLTGLASSPIFVNGLVALQVDQAANSYLPAFDSKNGELIWKTDRTETDSWSTPLVHRGQVVTVGYRMLGAYQISNGERTVSAPGFAISMVSSPVVSGDTLYAFGYNLEDFEPFESPLERMDGDGDGVLEPSEIEDFAMYKVLAEFQGDKDGSLDRGEYDQWVAENSGPSRLLAVRLKSDEGGQLSGAEELWDYQRSFVGVTPSPLVYDGVFYFLKNGGIVTAMDAATGSVLKQGRVREAADPYSASLVAAEGRIYLSSEAGKVSVLRAGADWEVLSVSDLGEPIYATPALSEGSVFIRSDNNLYRFGD